MQKNAQQANDVDDDVPHNTLDFIGRDDVFLELLDCPKTIAKVWGILGWNIQLYHSHMIVSPPLTNGEGKIGTMRWHQDSGRSILRWRQNHNHVFP